MKNKIPTTLLGTFSIAIVIGVLATVFSSSVAFWTLFLLSLAGLAEIARQSMKPHQNWHREALEARVCKRSGSAGFRRAA